MQSGLAATSAQLRPTLVAPLPAPGLSPAPAPGLCAPFPRQSVRRSGAGRAPGLSRVWKRAGAKVPGAGFGVPGAATAPRSRAALTRQLVVGAVQVAGVGQALLPALVPHLPSPPSGGGNRDGAHGLRRRAGGARARRPPPPPPRRPPHSPRQQEGAGGAGELGSERQAEPRSRPVPRRRGWARPPPLFRPSPPPPESRRPSPAAPGKLRHGPGKREGLRVRGREGAAPGCTEVGSPGFGGAPGMRNWLGKWMGKQNAPGNEGSADPHTLVGDGPPSPACRCPPQAMP